MAILFFAMWYRFDGLTYKYRRKAGEALKREAPKESGAWVSAKRRLLALERLVAIWVILREIRRRQISGLRFILMSVIYLERTASFAPRLLG